MFVKLKEKLAVYNFLHVASFTGNIGDNANHLGFYQKLELEIGEFSVTKFEIRETFRGDRSFDLDFVELCNQHDAVIFGGGNFFELWVERSNTGCSIDIPLEIIPNIEVPMIFNALGVDVGMGATSASIEKFKRFLDILIDREDVLLSCRNDGAFHNLETHIGANYASNFFRLHDAGFYFKPEKIKHHELVSNKLNILFQLAGDMPDVRFSPDSSEITYDTFLDEISSVITKLAISSNIILCPHIFRDLEIISEIMKRLPDKVSRENVSITPYIQGDVGANYIFSLYQQTDLNIAMRFHANVCSLANGCKTIGLVNYIQIENLYREIDLDKYIDVRKIGFGSRLEEAAKSELSAECGQILLSTEPAYINYIKAIKSLLIK